MSWFLSTTNFDELKMVPEGQIHVQWTPQNTVVCIYVHVPETPLKAFVCKSQEKLLLPFDTSFT